MKMPPVVGYGYFLESPFCLAFSNITIGNQGIIADKNSSCYGIIGGIICAHAGGGS